jgi:hypothetical protein
VRTLSTEFLQAVLANSTDEAFLLLITITHEALAQPVRVAANVENVVSRSWTFIGLPVEAELPGDEDDSPPVATIRIDNINQDIVRMARSIRTRANVTLEIVLGSDPDVVEVEVPTFPLASVSYDAFWVSGQLQVDDLASEPYPFQTFSPARFKAMY